MPVERHFQLVPRLRSAKLTRRRLEVPRYEQGDLQNYFTFCFVQIVFFTIFTIQTNTHSFKIQDYEHERNHGRLAKKRESYGGRKF